jgi:DNA helicase-2/ATP-dependent DNA helicase PcrA
MDHLTPDQLSAVTFDRGDPQNLLILACAGSGKTETLACRVAQMVVDGIDRSSIVAFTFTEHAATELKHRIRRKVEEAVPDEPSLGEMFVGTIHSFCLRVLRDHKPDYRVFEVMDETRQAALVAANFVRFPNGNGIGLDRLLGRTRSRTYGETLNTFLRTLNVIHQQEIDVDAIDDEVLSEAVSHYRDIAQGYPNYFSDFNDIVDRMITFLEDDPSTLTGVRGRLRHLLVDEYQDVDDRQEKLIRLLTNCGRGPTLTVVGDDDHALYGFRGARVRNILEFKQRYPEVREEVLQENFRSTHAIVEIADEAVRRIERRLPKEPTARWRRTKDGPLEEKLADPGDVVLRTFPSEAAEADWVAQRIEELHGVPFVEGYGDARGLDYGDMAILLRSVRGAGAAFAEALRRAGVPVVVTGTGGLFGNEEVQLVQAAFSLLARADFARFDDSGRMRLLSTAETREFIRGAVRRLRASGRLGESAHATAFLSWIARRRAELDQRAVAREGRSRRMGARIYPQQIFQEMLKELGAQADGWPPDSMYNLGAFSNLLTQFESVHQWITPARLKSLVLFLSNWAMRHVDEGGVGELAALNSVKIMTVHAAKGLEWPVVFLPRISSRVFPSSLRTRKPETFLPDGCYDASRYVGGDEGERRLWYVALTRCSKYLHVSSLQRPRTKPTGYFNEIRHDCVCGPADSPFPLPSKIAPRPPADADLLRTTYTDIAAFRRCEREYQLRTLMDFRPGVSEQFGYGQRIHDILAEIHQRAISGETVTPLDVRALVEARFHLRYTRGRPYEILKEAAVKALERYVKLARDTLPKARATEKPFELIDHDSGALISGVVDLLESAEARLLPSRRQIVGLVDFKASRIDTLEEYREVEGSVRDQLQLYAVGVRYAFDADPVSATARVISAGGLDDNLESEGCTEWIPVPVDTGSQEDASRRLASTVARIRTGLETGDFPTTGAAKGVCGKCDFRTFCSGYTASESCRGLGSTSLPAEEIEQQTDRLAEVVDAGPASE